MRSLAQFFPPLKWLPKYGSDDLQGDLVAGFTVGIMLIPQGMAYALIAGLPPIYGLYASLLPLVLYALFGTSKQLAVGPVAMVSLLVAAGVAPHASGDMGRYIELAVLLAFMVGVLQFAMGVARFGFLTNFLSHPVLSGFTSAAALIIGLNQLKHLLGIDLARSSYVHEILWGALQNMGATNLTTLATGVGSIVILVGLKRWNKAFPASLVVVVISILTVWGFDLHKQGVRIVGSVPSGLPEMSAPSLAMGDLQTIWPTALAIALVSFMESIAVAKVYASKNRYEVDANQELIGLGLANIGGALLQSYPVTGGFSRTAVNAESGAQTNLAGLISAGVIALTLLFLTPLFYYMPNAVLAAIVMVAVVGLIDVEEARFLWRVKRADFALMMTTFAATLGLGIEEGILVGVIVSLIVVIHRSSRPHSATMGRLPETNTFRNVKRHAEALTRSDVVVYRMDASLYFANTSFLKDEIHQIMVEDPALKQLVFDAYPVNDIDATGAETLKEIIEDFHESGYKFYFAGVKGPVMDVLKRAGVVDLVGEDHFFMEVHTAVEIVTDTNPQFANGAQPAEPVPARPPTTHNND